MCVEYIGTIYKDSHETNEKEQAINILSIQKRTVWVGGSVGFLVGETDGPAEGLRVGEAVGLLVG